MSLRAPHVIAERIEELLRQARDHETEGDIGAAWDSLGDAHVLSQPWVAQHVGVHASMLTLGWRARSLREVLGQLTRITLAGPASLLGQFPPGNSGRANISAFESAPIRSDLAELLATAHVRSSSRVLNPGEVRDLYDRMAPIYDLASKPYGWFDAQRLAEQAIDELRLQPGDTVVELGTGTGRNLAALSTAVGPSGRVIGVDLSPRMLAIAQDKADRQGLPNVELIEADMTSYDLPERTSAVLSTYAMEMLDNYDTVIARLVRQLQPGGRIALNGLRSPERWPEWIITLGSWLSRPFGVSDAYRTHRPWEAIHKHTTNFNYDEAMAGATYLAAGTAPRHS